MRPQPLRPLEPAYETSAANIECFCEPPKASRLMIGNNRESEGAIKEGFAVILKILEGCLSREKDKVHLSRYTMRECRSRAMGWSWFQSGLKLLPGTARRNMLLASYSASL